MFQRIEKAIPMITLLTVGTTVVFAIGQIIWGISTSSLLLCICSLFNIGMALAKIYSFKGMRGIIGKKEQLCYYNYRSTIEPLLSNTGDAMDGWLSSVSPQWQEGD